MASEEAFTRNVELKRRKLRQKSIRECKTIKKGAI